MVVISAGVVRVLVRVVVKEAARAEVRLEPIVEVG